MLFSVRLCGFRCCCVTLCRPRGNDMCRVPARVRLRRLLGTGLLLRSGGMLSWAAPCPACSSTMLSWDGLPSLKRQRPKVLQATKGEGHSCSAMLKDSQSPLDLL